METTALTVNIICGVIALTGFAFLAQYVRMTSILNEEKVRNQNPCAVWLARVFIAILFFVAVNHFAEIF